MTEKTKTDLLADIEALFTTNANGEITGSDLNQVATDIVESTINSAEPLIETTLTITPPTDGVALDVSQVGMGSTTSGGFIYNKFLILDYRDDHGVGEGTTGFQIHYGIEGSPRGPKVGFASIMERNVSNDPAFADADAVAGLFHAFSNSDNGGTDTGSGARGTAFGLSSIARLIAGATNFGVVSGGEIDVGILTGASCRYRWGWSIISIGDLQAVQSDAAIDISSIGSGAPAWQMGIVFNSLHGGPPVSTTGTLIGTDGTSATVANGIDFSAFTISGDFLKGPGFNVTGSGVVKTLTTTVTGLPSAATVGVGSRAFVTDSNATLSAGLGNTVVGSGSNKVPVYSDGTNWKIGG